MDQVLSDLAPDPATFGRHVSLVQDFVSRQPGAQSALMGAAREEPEAVTASIVTLGAVLLDIAAGAFGLAPEAMLEKVAERVREAIEAPAF